jgi:hypothetical protein
MLKNLVVPSLLISISTVGCGGNPSSSEANGSSGAAAFAGETASGGTPGSSGSTGVMSSGGSPTSGGSGAETGGTSGTGDAAGGFSIGGTSGVGGSGGAAGLAGSGQIDYSIWVLQLPIGIGTSPTTISSDQLLGGFSDAYFYPGSDGGQMFMDPATGTTTSGSKHCRSEMREAVVGGAQAAWSSSGTNTMTVSGKVLKVGGGSAGDVTVGQVFNGTDSIPLCELSYSTSLGGFTMLYEEAKGAGTKTDLKTPVALGTRYNFTLALSGGVLTVSINGKQVHSQMPSAAVLAKAYYFKFGDYDQTASAGAVSTTPYTVVETYSVAVVHQ